MVISSLFCFHLPLFASAICHHFSLYLTNHSATLPTSHLYQLVPSLALDLPFFSLSHPLFHLCLHLHTRPGPHSVSVFLLYLCVPLSLSLL